MSKYLQKGLRCARHWIYTSCWIFKAEYMALIFKVICASHSQGINNLLGKQKICLLKPQNKGRGIVLEQEQTWKIWV